MHKPMLNSVGRAIGEKRRARNLTQAELAERCGFRSAYISALENGDRNPTLITLARIAEALDWNLPNMMRSADL